MTILKKHSSGDPNNCRDITPVSYFAKIFTSLIKERLKISGRTTTTTKITDTKFVSKPDHKTTADIFVLKALTVKYLTQMKQLYAASIVCNESLLATPCVF